MKTPRSSPRMALTFKRHELLRILGNHVVCSLDRKDLDNIGAACGGRPSLIIVILDFPAPDIRRQVKVRLSNTQ